MATVYFLAKWWLEGYSIGRVKPDTIAFADPYNEFEISIARREGGLSRDLDLWAKTTLNIQESSVDVIDAAIVAVREKRYDDARWDDLPRQVQDLCISAEDFIQEKTERFISLIRWFDKAAGDLMAIPRRAGTPQLYWKTSLEQPHFYSIPSPRVTQLSFMHSRWHGIDPLTCTNDSFLELWKDEVQGDPLAHQLLREARNLAYTNPRAALLVAHTALEVGLKQHITNHAPDTEWLLKKIQSPPVRKLVTGLLPVIHSGSAVLRHIDSAKTKLSLSKQLDDFSWDRNVLAHQGEFNAEKFWTYLSLTGNLLYLLDVLDGRLWATRCLTEPFAEAFGLNAESTIGTP